jgi:hypothetical protein
MSERTARNGLDPLVLELLAWISTRPRTYVETMEVWRTSCPRHSVWEDALIDGLVELERATSASELVSLTDRGKVALRNASSSPSERR